MNGFFIAGYALFGVMSILGLIYLYTLFIYTKNTLFTKAKYSWANFAFYGLVFVILLVGGVLFLTTLKDQMPGENTKLHAGLCFGFLGIDILNVIGYVLIIYFNNKKKIPYDKIPTTDFKQALADTKAKIGDVEAFKNKLQKRHKSYFNKMNFSYQELLKRAKNEKISKADKLADIVMFNDTFTHKWCTFTNNYQLLLTYEFLTLI